jgi:hypothetical protein
MIRQDTVKWIRKRITRKNFQKSKVCHLTPNYAVCRKVIRKRSRFVRRGAIGKGLLQDSTSPVAYSTWDIRSTKCVLKMSVGEP